MHKKLDVNKKPKPKRLKGHKKLGKLLKTQQKGAIMNSKESSMSSNTKILVKSPPLQNLSQDSKQPISKVT